jgi:hypothetical protein
MPEAREHQIICVVGAPRCGTTSLSTWLGEHPDVCFSRVKEPHFFTQHDLTGCSDDELRERVRGGYLARYFPKWNSSAQVLAEGSVSYLYAPDRMEPILRLWPQAKFVIALRDPMAMLPSLHQRLLYLGDETETDFESAWHLLDDRRQGRNVPRSCIDPRALWYDEIGRLGHYVGRFFEAVGRERCFISVFDDLVRDPADVYGRLLEFTGLPDDGRRDFGAQRQGLGVRSAALQRLLKRPPRAVRGVMAGEKYRHRIRSLETSEEANPLVRFIFRTRRALLNWNMAPVPSKRLSPALRFELRDQFRDDIEHLSHLIGRDLGHWLSVQEPTATEGGDYDDVGEGAPSSQWAGAIARSTFQGHP